MQSKWYVNVNVRCNAYRLETTVLPNLHPCTLTVVAQVKAQASKIRMPVPEPQCQWWNSQQQHNAHRLRGNKTHMYSTGGCTAFLHGKPFHEFYLLYLEEIGPGNVKEQHSTATFGVCENMFIQNASVCAMAGYLRQMNKESRGLQNCVFSILVSIN
eukprot:1037031-Pleurochrysis_carterae.AAC.2